MEFILVGVGGLIGSVGRYFLTKILPVNFLMWNSFPLGTFAVNLIGSFLIGFGSFLVMNKILGSDFRLFVIVGILGGFTTFSSFGLDAFNMLMQKDYIKVIFYILGTNILGLLLVAVGWFLSKSLFQ